METLTADELEKRLKIECKARRWKVPSAKRLKKLREAGQLPKAIPANDKGKRGRSWRYDPDTIPAFVRAEEARRASGKRVRSWKLVELHERRDALRGWFEDLDAPVPREVIAEHLDAFSDLFRKIAPTIFPYVEHPVGPLDDDRLDDVHTAIEAMLDANNMQGEWRDAAEALLHLLTLRDEAGNADDTELAELIEPLRAKAGPFGRLGGGIAGLCGIVREIPLNGLLTKPRTLLDAVTDDELRACVRGYVRLFRAIERMANVATTMITTIDKAQSHPALRGNPRLSWCQPIADGTIWMTSLLQSELGDTLLCASALVNIWRVRLDPTALIGMQIATQSIETFAGLVEQFASAKKQQPLKH